MTENQCTRRPAMDLEPPSVPDLTPWLARRVTVREFEPDADIPDAEIRRLLDAGRKAPTSRLSIDPRSVHMSNAETHSLTIGVLRVLTLEEHEAIARHGRVIERHFPHVRTDSRSIPDHPDGIPNADAKAEALPYITELGREMAPDVDVLTVSCALDPGVSSLDDDLHVPVVGAGASVAAAALGRGHTVGTLGLEGNVPPNVRALLGEHLCASESVTGAETTNYLTTDAGRESIRASVAHLAQTGCDVVAPTCTGMTTAGVLPDLRSESRIPIVDPVVAMGAMAVTAAGPSVTEEITDN